MTKLDWIKYWIQRGWWIGSSKRAREYKAMERIEIKPISNNWHRNLQTLESMENEKQKEDHTN